MPEYIEELANSLILDAIKEEKRIQRLMTERKMHRYLGRHTKNKTEKREPLRCWNREVDASKLNIVSRVVTEDEPKLRAMTTMKTEECCEP